MSQFTMRKLLRFMLIVLLSLLCSLQASFVVDAIATSSSGRSSSSSSSSATVLEATTVFPHVLKFSGQSKQSVSIDKHLVQHQKNWFMHDCAIFLGTNDYKILKNGNDNDNIYQCQQPSMSLFGLTLQPTYTIKIATNQDGNNNKIECTILESQLKTISKHEYSNAKTQHLQSIISEIMSQTCIQGKCNLQFISTNNNNNSNVQAQQDELEYTMSLKVTVPVPNVPFGFRSIFKNVMKLTCRKRCQSLLQHMKTSFTEFCQQQEKMVTNVQGTE